MRLLLIVLCLTLIKCREVPHTKTVQINAEFEMIVQFFLQEARAHGKPIILVDLIARFGQIKAPVIGECYNENANSTPTIIIDSNYWKFSGPIDQEVLMLHELGHCVLGRDHLNSKNKDNQPISIMNEYMLDSYYYEANKEHYLQEYYGRPRIVEGK